MFRTAQAAHNSTLPHKTTTSKVTPHHTSFIGSVFNTPAGIEVCVAIVVGILYSVYRFKKKKVDKV